MRDQSLWLVELVKAALGEDVGPGDLTSMGCLEPNPAKARIVAKQDGVLSGLRPMLLVFGIVDSANTVRVFKNDGDRFAKGETLVEIEGFNQSMLAGERVALNFLSHLSGIATLTAKFVAAVAGTGARILDTRKTTPGMRVL
ncbi:MAG TPA: nicotinate-nucleotide diphosphorylase (carboxylating), partial [candidate division Zixibacteria bacterium]|nr:nicotinate-nucleotide diphosphorylase (carboxylating) [candidate division Zixibacteria bacterium]